MVKGENTAYFDLEWLWVALNLEKDNPRHEIDLSYTKVAFSIEKVMFDGIYEKLKSLDVNILSGRSRNKKVKNFIYFTDPDGHKFEFHTDKLHDVIFGLNKTTIGIHLITNEPSFTQRILYAFCLLYINSTMVSKLHSIMKKIGSEEMGRLKRFLQKLFFEKYDQFAEEMGYPDWNIALENTFGIYEMEGDTWYQATQLPDKKWAVWNDDEAEPPYAFEVFSSWDEAIRELRKLFQESGLPEDHWRPEGFDEGEDAFLKEPEREKML